MKQSVPIPVRRAFLWARLEGLTCPEIAERLGVSLATAERYIATALRHCYALHFSELKADFKAVPSKLALDILINACA
jgi:DNA-directed RNA polymerase specialized sigma24 family protein